MEDKKLIARRLLKLLNTTRAAKHILWLSYWKEKSNGEEYVGMYYSDGKGGVAHKEICVTADSGLALIKDVLQHID